MADDANTAADQEFKRLSRAFNRWMSDFLGDPASYEPFRETTENFLRERTDGVEPTYGDQCAATLMTLLEMDAPK